MGWLLRHQAPGAVTDRLDGMMDAPHGVEDELKTSLASRTILPAFHRMTGFIGIGGLLPQRTSTN